MTTAPTLPTAPATLPPAEWLVCVYYRVAPADSASAIRAVREFQRTLQDRFGDLEPQVLLRCELPPADPSSHASPQPAAAPDPTSAVQAHVDPGMEHTLMETYRLAPSAAGTDAPVRASLSAFLEALDTQATQSLSGLLRSTRHVELFAPCAS